MFSDIVKFTKLAGGGGGGPKKPPWASKWGDMEESEKTDWCTTHLSADPAIPGYDDHCPVASV
jgi:hypothetical protein